MSIFSILTLILLVLTANILWFWLKSDLKKKGYEAHFFSGHFHDLSNAADVIKNSEEPSTKRIYRNVLYSIIGIIILIPIIFFINIESFESNRCKRFNDYINYQVNGVIESKFIDKPNHGYETLKLENGTEKNEITIFVAELYQFLQPGDSISKTSGNSALRVYRNGQLTTFNVESKTYCEE